MCDRGWAAVRAGQRGAGTRGSSGSGVASPADAEARVRSVNPRQGAREGIRAGPYEAECRCDGKKRGSGHLLLGTESPEL